MIGWFDCSDRTLLWFRSDIVITRRANTSVVVSYHNTAEHLKGMGRDLGVVGRSRSGQALGGSNGVA
jgi:hypothetical protein